VKGAKTIAKLKTHPRVAAAWSEHGTDDGYWIALKSGWRAGDCVVHGIHEYTIKALLASFADVTKCTCQNCKNDALEGGAK